MKIGRPTKPGRPGERVSLGLRVTAELKARLEMEATRAGRSQSQEAEFRLERSLTDDEVLKNSVMRSWAHRMASEFFGTGHFHFKVQGGAEASADHQWMSDRLAYQTAMYALIRRLLLEMPQPTEDNVRLHLLQLNVHLSGLEKELLGKQDGEPNGTR